ncbi:MAG: MBOAT family protein, partial [Flavobacteriales bacterium]|nr:MBOAT family protein [Flavobacteriales bacterium]
MVFSSIFFLFHFLPLFFLVYHVTPQKFRNYVILLASLFFYSWGAPAFVFVLTGAIIINFFVVQKLFRTDKAYPRKVLLVWSLVLNLGLLAYFKYANFFVDNVNHLLSVFGTGQIEWIRVALPIGISFFTFQSITYSVDVYRKIHAPFEKLSNYMLYIISFPQMIAGPIVRYREIADEIIHREERIDDKLIGFYRFIIGLAKKVLIANVMAEQAEQIFSQMDGLSAASAWIGMLAYTMQIYFDFSGYSDMAIGLGKMMGLHFPENFNSPYISKSITEFWRRWHITLGTFMKEYLYIPLGGNRVTRSRLFFNLC